MILKSIYLYNILKIFYSQTKKDYNNFLEYKYNVDSSSNNGVRFKLLLKLL